MRPLAYERASEPGSAAAAVLARPDAKYLAGGTNLVDLMKLGIERSGLLVDITELGYDRVEHREDGSVLVGATVPNADLAGDPVVRRRFPVLSQAILAGASGQLRNVATTGGNLLQRSRCVYFTDVTKPCNKREPGTGCPAVPGAHRELGVLGTSEHCVAHHQSDMAVALAALDARVHLRRSTGEEEALALEDFYVLPGSTPHVETVLAPGDLITGVELPAPPVGAAMAYRKVRDRWSYAYALVSVAALVRLTEDGLVDQVRLALGGMAPRPWRARAAEERLLGGPLSAEAVQAAMAAELAVARPLPQNAFKLDLATDLVAAVLRDLTTGQEQR